MGGVTSKSPLERRNTVARRSQRRSIYNVKAKVDKVFPDIKRFKGVEQDVNYNALRSEIEHLKNELTRKFKDLQPQIRNIYDNTLNRIEEAFKALEDKLRDNQEKAKRKQQEIQEKEEKKKDKKKKEDKEPVNEDNDVEIQEIEEEQPKTEAETLEESNDKRQTVELKFVQIVPDEVTKVEVHSENNNNIATSPEHKRKSILKMGVAVMPGAMMNEISARSSNITRQYKTESYTETDSEKIIAKVNDIIENLQAVEYQIADFVGRKHGTQYNRIRDRLNHHLVELSLFNTNDDYTIEQIKICKNYVGSCLHFLDEKSIDDKLHGDVFFPPDDNPVVKSPPPSSPRSNNSLSPIDARIKLEKLTKTTAI